MDLKQFKNWINEQGYTIGHGTNHPFVLSPDGKDKDHFAIAHKKGAKKYVPGAYVKKITDFIKRDTARRSQ